MNTIPINQFKPRQHKVKIVSSGLIQKSSAKHDDRLVHHPVIFRRQTGQMLGHLILKIQERGDMDKNDEENEACEIFRMICKEALQTEYKVFDAGIAGSVESIRTHNKLSSIGKRRTIREAHIILTEINELFNNLNNSLAR